MINIDELIHNYTKSRDELGISVCRLIKAEFLKAEKDKKTVDEKLQNKILYSMIDQRRESAKIYTENRRPDLAQIETEEADFIEQFVPERASNDEIIKYTEEIIKAIEETENRTISMKDMKSILSKVQDKYSTAEGKLVSQIVKNLCGIGTGKMIN